MFFLMKDKFNLTKQCVLIYGIVVVICDGMCGHVVLYMYM